MHPGWTRLTFDHDYPGDVVHTALLEVFPQLGVDIRYESILNLIIDARAGCSAAVPLESITVIINAIGDHRCEVLLDGYVRPNPDLPRDYAYPSNSSDIARALDQRLRSPLPIRPVSFQEQLRMKYRETPRRKPNRFWTLATVMVWAGLAYWFLK